MYFLSFNLYKHVTTSASERIEYPRNFLNSALLWPVEPSAIFNATLSEALLICEVRLNFSWSGNVNDTWKIYSP